MPASNHADDYDSPWKDAVEQAFPEFIAFYFPDAHRQISWDNELWHDIERIEGERNVKYVTSVERLAIKRGIEQGMEKGLEQGLEKGRAEGRAEGRAAMLSRQLTHRFGPLTTIVRERLSQATPEQLDLWAERVLDASRLDDVFAEN